MEGFSFDDNEMRADKPNSKLRFCTLREAKKFLRFIEICLLLVFLTWASRRLPLAVRISGEYFRQLVTLVLSHLFIFLLSNIIVLTLFFKSRNLFLQHDFHNLSETSMDFCQEFVETSCAVHNFTGKSSPQPEEILYQDKQTILEVSKVKVHRRSQSEKFGRESSLEEDHNGGGCAKQLRRSETERQRRMEEVEVVDELSNEEFQKAIEEFIAKQIKFHQEEKLAIVPSRM